MSMYQRLNLFLRIARVTRNLSSNTKNIQNYYEVLGVEPTATQLDIKNSYFEKTKLYHPDVVGENDANLIKFRQISEAYEVLGSPSLRKDYDERVLGIIERDAGQEDPIGEYRRRMSSRRISESDDWLNDYLNEMRINEYVSKHVKKSVNDFIYEPRQQLPKTKFEKFSHHRLTKFVSTIIIGLAVLGYSISESLRDFIFER